MLSALIFGSIWGSLIGIAILIVIAMYVLPVLLPLLGAIIGIVLSGMVISHFAEKEDNATAAKKTSAQSGTKNRKAGHK